MNTQEVTHKLEEMMNLRGVEKFNPCNRWDHVGMAIRWTNGHPIRREIFTRKLAETMFRDGKEFRLTPHTVSYIIAEVDDEMEEVIV